MVIERHRLSFIPVLFLVSLLVSVYAYSFDNTTCPVHLNGREFQTQDAMCEKKPPSCYLAGHRSFNCVRQHLAREWGITPERVIYLGQTKFGETYQVVLEMLSLEKYLFPESGTRDKLIRKLRKSTTFIYSEKARDVLPVSLWEFVLDLNNIWPVLIETGQWIAEHPDWNPDIFETSDDIQQGMFHYAPGSFSSDQKKPDTIRYPLPDDNWKPASWLLPDLLTDELDRQLATMGFDIPSPYFLNFIPPKVADQVVEQSVFLDSPTIIDMIHGMNTHQLQILSAYKAGVLDISLLWDIVEAGQWSYLFDIDPFQTNNLYVGYSEQFEWDDKLVTYLIFKWDSYTLRSPYTIHMNLLSGDFSRSIEKALAQDQLTDHSVRKTLGLTSEESLDEAINAVKTLEHYTRYRHYQTLYEIYQSLLNTDLESELSFRDFVQEHYVDRESVQFSNNRWRKYAVRKSVQESLLEQDVTVFSVFRDDNGAVQVTELESGVSVNGEHGFIVLKPGPEGIVNQGLINSLRDIAHQIRMRTSSENPEPFSLYSYGLWLYRVLFNGFDR